MPPLRSLILGHSIARRLGEFIDSDRGRFDPNFRMGSGISVEISGVGSSKVSSLLEDLDRVDEVRPDICVLVIGGNDVDVDILAGTEEGENHALEIAYHILCLASLLHNRHGVSAVVICQLLPRYPRSWLFTDGNMTRWINYTAHASRVNRCLHEEIASGQYPFALFWQHQSNPGKFYFPFPAVDQITYVEDYSGRRAVKAYAQSVSRNRYLWDGVHLNRTGCYYLYRSIRGALATGLRHVNILHSVSAH